MLSVGWARVGVFIAVATLCAVPAKAALTGSWTVGATSGTAAVLGANIGVNGATGPPYGVGTTFTTNHWTDPYDGSVFGQPSLLLNLTPFGTTRTVTVTFDEPVTDPVLHVDRLGSPQGLVSFAMISTVWTLSASVPAGVTLTRLGGTPEFTVSDGAFRRIAGTTPLLGNEECDPGPLLAPPAGCGSVRFNGANITSLTFTVTWDDGGVPVTAPGDVVEFVWSFPHTKVNIRKATSGSTGQFAFTGTNGVGNVTLDTTLANPTESAEFPITSYALPIEITETDGLPYLTGVTCSGSITGPVSHSLFETVATISPANYHAVHQRITCEFTNTITTAAGLMGFRARRQGGATALEWATSWERGTLGFELLRQDPKTGGFDPVTGAAARGGLASLRGATYRWLDPDVRPGENATYRLREKEATGHERLYGPYTVNAERSATRPFTAFERPVVRRKPALLHTPAAEATISFTKGRVLTARDGLVYVSAAQLAQTLGQSPTAIISRIQSGGLRLREQGQPIAWVRGPSNQGLYFYGRGLDSPFTRFNAYQLDFALGTIVSSTATALAAPVEGQSFVSSVHAEENLIAAPFAGGDPDGDFWYWNLAVAGETPPSFVVSTPGAVLSGTATLDVWLRGGSSGADTRRHHAVVKIGGVAVGEGTWDGMEPFRLRSEFDAGLLQDGTNEIVVEAILDSGYTFSVFLVDSIDVAYPRACRAEGNALRLRAGENATVTVDGFTSPSIAVLDLQNPRLPRRLTSAQVSPSGAGYRVSFTPADGTREYLAASLPAAAAPDAVEPDATSNLRSATNRGSYLVLTPASLKAGADALAAYRSARFRYRRVVDLQDIYDEFGFGLTDPRAVRSFLAHATSTWATPPTHVVLVGKGTIDPKNYTGYDTNVFPVLSVSTPSGLYASDSRFADFIGNDAVPDVALGRIPALSVVDVTAYVDKLRAYETTTGAWTGRGVFLADNPDGGGNFAAGSDEIAAHAAIALATDKIHHVSDVADTRQRLFTSLNLGASLFNYAGHASIDYLAEEQLLRAGDAASLTNGAGAPVFLALTCIVGDGTLPGIDSLAETLLWKSGGGITASFAPTGQSLDKFARELGAGVVDRLFAPGSSGRLGDATRGALVALAATNAPRHIREIYQILGDPAVVVRR